MKTKMNYNNSGIAPSQEPTFDAAFRLLFSTQLFALAQGTAIMPFINDNATITPAWVAMGLCMSIYGSASIVLTAYFLGLNIAHPSAPVVADERLNTFKAFSVFASWPMALIIGAVAIWMGLNDSLLALLALPILALGLTARATGLKAYYAYLAEAEDKRR